MLVFVAARTTMMKRAIHSAIQSLDVTLIDAAERAQVGIYYISSFDDLRDFNAASPDGLPKILLAADPYFTQIVSVQLAATTCIKVPFLSSRLRRAVFESLGLPYRVEEAYENANRPLPIISKKVKEKRSEKAQIPPALKSQIVASNETSTSKKNVVTAVGMPALEPNTRQKEFVGGPTRSTAQIKKMVDRRESPSISMKNADRTVSGMPAIPRVPARPESETHKQGTAPTESSNQRRSMASKGLRQNLADPTITNEYGIASQERLLRHKTDADLPVVSSLHLSGSDTSESEHCDTVESMAIQSGDLERVVEGYLRPHIEKVVWSVVPRLAERLIRDEIEKVVGSSLGMNKPDTSK